MIKISIVIGSFNQKHVLEKTLQSLADQSLSPSDYEIIVSDSRSTDGTEELLSNFAPACTFRYRIQTNSGKASARNVGVRMATSPYIVITDADTIADHHFIEAHLNAQESASTPTCFEGLEYHLSHLHWPIDPQNIRPCLPKHYPNRAKLGWYYFLTGNLSFPKALFDQASGFDEDFTGYGWEDLELGYRLSLQKVPLLYLKTAINYHYHIVDESAEYKRNIAKGQSARVFLRKHPELKSFLGLNPVSEFVFKRVYPKGKVFRWADRQLAKKGLRHQFAHWFMKEFHYLEGILIL